MTVRMSDWKCQVEDQLQRVCVPFTVRSRQRLDDGHANFSCWIANANDEERSLVVCIRLTSSSVHDLKRLRPEARADIVAADPKSQTCHQKV